jgi:hypothetical protein
MHDTREMTLLVVLKHWASALDGDLAQAALLHHTYLLVAYACNKITLLVVLKHWASALDGDLAGC